MDMDKEMFTPASIKARRVELSWVTRCLLYLLPSCAFSSLSLGTLKTQEWKRGRRVQWVLKASGLDANQMNTVLRALTVSLISYALLPWGVFLSAGQCGNSIPRCGDA